MPNRCEELASLIAGLKAQRDQVIPLLAFANAQKANAEAQKAQFIILRNQFQSVADSAIEWLNANDQGHLETYTIESCQGRINAINTILMNSPPGMPGGLTPEQQAHLQQVVNYYQSIVTALYWVQQYTAGMAMLDTQIANWQAQITQHQATLDSLNADWILYYNESLELNCQPPLEGPVA